MKIRRSVSSRGASAVLTLLFSFLLAVAHGERAQPNFVLFLADDMTWRDLGVMGNEDVLTPHLDRLAAEGMTLTRLFTGTAMCSPTRQQLYTGLYPARNGAYPNHSVVYEGTRSLVHHLENLGYRVALKGKRHFGPADSFSFEYLGGIAHDPGPGVGLDLDIEKIRTFIGETGNDPWCLVVASNQPHTPWNRGDPGLYDADALTLPPNLVDLPETREAITRYYGEITYMDRQLGQVAAVLEETKQERNTLFMWTNEQGFGLPFAKWTNYDAGLRATAIVRWPGRIRPGTRSSALVEYVDVVPTLVEIAGGNPGETDTGREGAADGGRGFDGRSFLPVLLGETDHHKDYVFGIQTTRGIHHGSEAYPIRSVRDDRYKLIWNLASERTFENILTESGGPGGLWKHWREAAKTDPHAASLVHRYKHRPEYELYDLENDPYERVNLYGVAKETERVRILQTKLEEWMNQQGDLGLETEMRAHERQIQNQLVR